MSEDLWWVARHLPSQCSTLIASAFDSLRQRLDPRRGFCWNARMFVDLWSRA
jgi:hypothetical protein